MNGIGLETDRRNDMDMGRIEVYATYEMWRRGVEFRLFDRKVKKQPPDLTAGEFNRRE